MVIHGTKYSLVVLYSNLIMSKLLYRNKICHPSTKQSKSRCKKQGVLLLVTSDMILLFICILPFSKDSTSILGRTFLSTYTLPLAHVWLRPPL